MNKDNREAYKKMKNATFASLQKLQEEIGEIMESKAKDLKKERALTEALNEAMEQQADVELKTEGKSLSEINKEIEELELEFKIAENEYKEAKTFNENARAQLKCWKMLTDTILVQEGNLVIAKNGSGEIYAEEVDSPDLHRKMWDRLKE